MYVINAVFRFIADSFAVNDSQTNSSFWILHAR